MLIFLIFHFLAVTWQLNNPLNVQEICNVYFLPSKISLSFKSESMLWKLYNCDYWRPKVNDKFDSVWSSNLGKTQYIVEMEKNLENSDFGMSDANVKIRKKNTDNVIKVT